MNKDMYNIIAGKRVDLVQMARAHLGCGLKWPTFIRASFWLAQPSPMRATRLKRAIIFKKCSNMYFPNFITLQIKNKKYTNN